MRPSRRIGAMALAVVLLWAGRWGMAATADGAQARGLIRPQAADTLSITSHTVIVGDEFIATIRVTGDIATVGVDAGVDFVPTCLEVLQIIPVDNGLDELYGDFNNSAGYIRYSKNTFGSAVSPAFDLVRVKFRAKQQTAGTPLSFDPDYCDVIDANGVSVLAGLVDGTVVIQEPLTDTPTPTKTPTRRPTNTPTPRPTPRPGNLCVLAFHDLNGNLLQEVGEPLIAGATIRLFDVGMALVDSYTTDGVHEPRCWSLQPGTYFAQETDPPGYLSVGPDWWAVGLLSDADVILAFADQPAPATATATPTATGAPTATATTTPTWTPTRAPTATPTATPVWRRVYLPLLLKEGGAPGALGGVLSDATGRNTA